VVPIADLGALLRDGLTAWREVRLAEVIFGHRDATILALIALVGLAIGVAVIRVAFTRRPGRGQIGLPALMQWAGSSPLAWLRHGALLLALAGVPLFMIALADPYTPLRQEEVSFPGRRIAILIDASASMVIPFQAARLNPDGPNQASFFTTVGAAETFIRQRMNGKYRDLLALIEFGDEAYVVTPFTNDYENILLSLSLVGDWTEYLKFSDQGTTIGKAIDQGVALFRAFEFLNAAGNAMIIFSDGQDRQAIVEGRPIEDIIAGARQAKIPVYLIRIGQNKALGDVVPDSIWQPAVEATGGRFYAASDETAIFRAINEIDRRSSGSISIRQYSTELPQFSPFALAAVMLWTVALTLKLTVPFFQKFP
jgi:Ca-activated chloride channel family protein